MSGLHGFHMHVGLAVDDIFDDFRAIAAVQPRQFASSEAAARFYLDRTLEATGREFLHVVAPERAARVPDLELLDTQRSPVVDNHLVRFRQTHQGVPVFGSRVVVELRRSQALVSIDARTATAVSLPTSAIAGLAPSDALAVLADHVVLDDTFIPLIAPQLIVFSRSEYECVLAYHLLAAPAELAAAEDPAGLGSAMTLDSLSPDAYHYITDASSGEILLAYAAQATLDVATLCRGTDDLGAQQEFHGRRSGSGYEMVDPDRGITTHDLAYADVGAVVEPLWPVNGPSADWGTSKPAAVSAHVNATRVHDFYESVLHRDGIDGKGMPLMSLVNVGVQVGSV